MRATGIPAWLTAMFPDPKAPMAPRDLLRKLQDGELSHPDLMRRSRRIHERRFAAVVTETIASVSAGNLGVEDDAECFSVKAIQQAQDQVRAALVPSASAYWHQHDV